jgi:hypothetical protein
MHALDQNTLDHNTLDHNTLDHNTLDQNCGCLTGASAVQVPWSNAG